MYITYDQEADAMAVRFCRPQGRIVSQPLDDHRRIVDYDEETGEPVGVEFLFVGEGVDLRGIPEADRIRELLKSLGKLAA